MRFFRGGRLKEMEDSLQVEALTRGTTNGCVLYMKMDGYEEHTEKKKKANVEELLRERERKAQERLNAESDDEGEDNSSTSSVRSITKKLSKLAVGKYSCSVCK